MRIWSLHPKYLDAKGLVALWRETLLAKKVLEGNTKGYTNHSQLIRFRNSSDPLVSINRYLFFVLEEAKSRGYLFNQEKIDREKCSPNCELIPVTTGQVEFERKHLLAKLKLRDVERYRKFLKVEEVELHPLFELVEGEMEEWERN